jgi:hypothetical protein
LCREIATSNNDPRVIARFNLDTITSLCGIVPIIIRSYHGTENVTVRKLQIFLDKDMPKAMQRRELLPSLCWFKVKFTI